MLDKKTERMLQAAGTLTAEELDELRGSAISGAIATGVISPDAGGDEDDDLVGDPDETTESESPAANEPDASTISGSLNKGSPTTDPTRGARERARTRASKVSTACLGQPREAHEWWPVGTELIGAIGAETFTAVVIENPGVKSNRSLQLTSGAATGTVCLTPTRAAIEATEAYRQAHKLGRGGGITNGWSFWKPRA